MQCLHCHFEFRSARHYGRHLWSQHPNEPVAPLFDEPRVDIQELSAAVGSKRGRALTWMIPEPSKHPRSNVQTPEIANKTPGGSTSQEDTRNECGGIQHNRPDPQESIQVVAKPGKGPLRLPPRYEAGRIVKVCIFQDV
jgi:hypothetical protein